MATKFKLTKHLDKEFLASDLFLRAITHRSVSKKHNERLEFLGDSILGMIITEKLYSLMPKASEGYLSRLRASLVNESSLAEIAAQLSLGDFLRLGIGELKAGGFRRKSILSDTLEAVIASIYLTKGFDYTRDFVLTIYTERLTDLPSEDSLKDPKSRLQELLQAKGYDIPQYEVLDIKGEAHKQSFTAQCIVHELDIRTIGQSSSRRKAEQQAAEAAFQQASALDK